MNFHIDITSPVQLLSLVCSIVGVLGLTIFPAFRGQRDTAIKIFGGLLVAGIGFSAANPWIYPIAIFIVATLVTELEFLEKLAAIVWNRKEYWQYLISKASPSEIKRKIEQDVRATPELKVSTVPDNRRELIKDAIAFENAVVAALSSDNPLKAEKIEKGVSITGEGYRLIVDCIAHTPDATYVIEIKAAANLSILDRGVAQLRRYAHAFEKYSQERGIARRIVLVLVVPSSSNLPDALGDVGILKFDKSTGKFTNLNEFRRLVQQDVKDEEEQ